MVDVDEVLGVVVTGGVVGVGVGVGDGTTMLLLLSLFEKAKMPSPIRAPPPAIHHQTGMHGPPPAWHFSPPCACFTPAAPPGAIGPVDEAAGREAAVGEAADNAGNGAKTIATLTAAETSAFFTFRPSFFGAPEILYHRK